MWLAFFDYEILDGIEYPDHDKFAIADFIKELYIRRKQDKARGDSMERAYKILLNAGYGIWATRQHTTRSVTEQSEYATYYKLWEETGKSHEFQKSMEMIPSQSWHMMPTHNLALDLELQTQTNAMQTTLYPFMQSQLQATHALPCTVICSMAYCRPMRYKTHTASTT